MWSSKGEVDQPCHPRLEHVSMFYPPPPPYMFINVEESHYVQLHGPIVEANFFIPNISIFSFFKLHIYAN